MNDIAQIELTISQAKEQVRRRDDALKLAGNREFKKLVLDGYFKEEAARLVSLSADSMVKDSREDIFIAIQGISTFEQYMKTIVHFGNMAAREIVEHEALLDEVRNDDDEAV